MQEKLDKILSNALEEIEKSQKEADLANVKAKYLGKKSEITELMSSLKDMSVEDKKKYGQLFNKIKNDISQKVDDKLESFNNSVNYSFDPTKPVNLEEGSLSPITIVSKEVTDILKRMGFTVMTGPEMESEYFNFEALNIP